MAPAAGAEFVYPCEVTGLDLSFGRLRGVRSTRGDFPCDVLVVACGTGTPRGERAKVEEGVRVAGGDAETAGGRAKTAGGRAGTTGGSS